MKFLLSVFVFFSLITVKAQPTGPQFNFILEGEKVRWQKVMEKDTASIRQSILLNKAFQIVQTAPDYLILDVNDYPYDKNGYTCSGRAKIEFKEGKYRITFSDISWKPGSDGKLMASIVAGVTVDMIFYADKELAKKGRFRERSDIMGKLNNGITKLFTFEEIKKNDDW